jgi:ribonuclease HI
MYIDGGSVWICWVPSHIQIPENEAADQVVKKNYYKPFFFKQALIYLAKIKG